MSPKHHLEFQKLVKIMKICLKVLQNVKTRWINMLPPLKWVGKKYKTLITKMVVDNNFVELIKAHLLNLCDTNIILGLPCILPMLEYVNGLMKFVQSRDVFMCDYITTVKHCQADLYKMYINLNTSFQAKNFLVFIKVV